MLLSEINSKTKLTDFLIVFDGYYHTIEVRNKLFGIFPYWEILTDNNEIEYSFKTKEDAIDFINYLLN